MREQTIYSKSHKSNKLQLQLWLILAVGVVLVALGIYIITRKQEPQVIHVKAPATTTTSPVQATTTTSALRRTVQVNAKEKWKDSGINVKQGQVVSVTASGSVMWDRDLPAVGPDGTFKANTVETPNDFPMPSAGCGSLLMRIGTSIYAVGSSDTVTAGESGMIRFMVNDRYEYLGNNSGSFQVQVEVK